MVCGRVRGVVCLMKFLRLMAAVMFLVGAVTLTAGIACSGGDEKADDRQIQEFDARSQTPEAKETLTPSATSTATATPVNTPTATPTPFNGNVARMRIPSLAINYPTEKLGLKNGNELDTPHNATGAIGWYEIAEYPNLAKPGFGGDAMFSAHVNYNGSNGPFANLYKIEGGAEIFVSMDGGPEYKYQVFAIHGYVIDQRYATATRPLIDMGKLIDAPDKPQGEEWVTLITCSCGPGRVIIPAGQQFGECLDRDVVLAKRVS